MREYGAWRQANAQAFSHTPSAAVHIDIERPKGSAFIRISVADEYASRFATRFASPS